MRPAKIGLVLLCLLLVFSVSQVKAFWFLYDYEFLCEILYALSGAEGDLTLKASASDLPLPISATTWIPVSSGVDVLFLCHGMGVRPRTAQAGEISTGRKIPKLTVNNAKWEVFDDAGKRIGKGTTKGSKKKSCTKVKVPGATASGQLKSARTATVFVTVEIKKVKQKGNFEDQDHVVAGGVVFPRVQNASSALSADLTDEEFAEIQPRLREFRAKLLR